MKLYGFNDFVFIRIDKPYASLIKYDYSSEKIDFMNEELYDLYGYEFIGDNILLVYEDNMMKYTYCDSINLIDIKSIELSDTHNLQFSLVENNYLYITTDENKYEFVELKKGKKLISTDKALLINEHYVKRSE